MISGPGRCAKGISLIAWISKATRPCHAARSGRGTEVSGAGLVGVHSDNRDQHRPPHQRPRCLTALPGKTMAKKSGESSEQKRPIKRAKAVQISQTGALPPTIESLRRRTPSKFGPYVTRRRTSRGRARELTDIGSKRIEVENPAYSDGVRYTS